MNISDKQRQQLIKELSSAFANASGYSANVSDVNQWDVASDAVIRTIEGILEHRLSRSPEPAQTSD